MTGILSLHIRVRAFFEAESLAEMLAETLIENSDARVKVGGDWNIGDGQLMMSATHVADGAADSWNYFRLKIDPSSKLGQISINTIGERLVERLGGDLELVDGPPSGS